MDKDLDEKRILQKKIIETVEKIEDADILEYLHTFIKLFLASPPHLFYLIT